MKNWNQEKILTLLEHEYKTAWLTQGKHGLERETLRVDPNGMLALTPHPKEMSDPFTDPFITTDFSESQLEFITAPHETVDAAVESLTDIHKRAIAGLQNDEILWPSSMPCILPAHDDIPVAEYGDDPKAKEKEIYRNGLAHRYGKYVQTLCGVHYNMSFSEELWSFLHRQFAPDTSLQDFKNQSTLGLVRNFIRVRWLLVYLLGGTPLRHESYRCNSMTKFDMQTSIALRSSKCGYHNPDEVKILYNDFTDHLASIDQAMNTPYEPYAKFGGPPAQLNDHLLQIANEYYFPIRMKPTPHDEGFLEGLKENGVAYIELRILDINPHTPTGVDIRSLKFSHLFMCYCWLQDSPGLVSEQKKADKDQENIAVLGRAKLPEKYLSEGKRILNEMKPLAMAMGQDYEEVLQYFATEFAEPKTLHWKKMLDEIKENEQDFIAYTIAKSYQHKHALQDE